MSYEIRQLCAALCPGTCGRIAVAPAIICRRNPAAAPSNRIPPGTAIRHGLQPAIAAPVLLAVCPRGAAGVHGCSDRRGDDVPRPARAKTCSRLAALESLVLWPYPVGARHG